MAMPTTERDPITRIGRTLAVAILVYLVMLVMGVVIASLGLSIHPFLAVLLGLGVVYVGLSLYYYRHPEVVDR